MILQQHEMDFKPRLSKYNKYYYTLDARWDWKKLFPLINFSFFLFFLTLHALHDALSTDTSSYVNVVSEEQERQVALLGLEVNLADASVYPASIDIHDQVVAAIARMWHAPSASPNPVNTDYSGAGTVGSTEACLLGMYTYIYIYIAHSLSLFEDVSSRRMIKK
jgi:hypothetical protein